MPSWLLDLFTRYGYGAVFFGVLLEGAGLPVPGETVLLAGAVLAHAGHLSLVTVIGTAVAGAVAGDNLGFLIGRLGGRRLLERYRIPGLTAHRLREFDRFFERYGPRTVFFARFVTGLRVICAVLAGGSRLAWRTFAFYNFAGILMWGTAVGAAGYLLGHSWELLERWIGRSSLVALAGIAAAAVFVVMRAKGRATGGRADG